MADSAAPATARVPAPVVSESNPLKRLYHWILSWANHPWGSAILAVLAFLDSSVFPIPPLFLQVALSLEKPKRSFWYAFIDTAASVVGSILGFYIGYALWESVGVHIIGVEAKDKVGVELKAHAFSFILAYSFLPFPYKVITIGSGVFHGYVSLPTLLLASTIGRGWRFFLLGGICFFMGNRAKVFIEKYFTLVCLAVGTLVAAVIAYMIFFVKKH
jgi:membrane protein YqaA with SNARE-associated domain